MTRGPRHWRRAISVDDTERARQTVASFRAYLEENRDEIAALQFLLGQPYGAAAADLRPDRGAGGAASSSRRTSGRRESLWQAYAQLERDRVRGVGAKRVLTDLVSLVRHAVQMDDELVPYPELVRRALRGLAGGPGGGRARRFTEEQRWWLDRIAEAIGVNLA